jgi:hypothetical protein
VLVRLWLYNSNYQALAYFGSGKEIPIHWFSLWLKDQTIFSLTEFLFKGLRMIHTKVARFADGSDRSAYQAML